MWEGRRESKRKKKRAAASESEIGGVGPEKRRVVQQHLSGEIERAKETNGKCQKEIERMCACVGVHVWESERACVREQE